ncbi:MAG: hypothetical protein LQ338_002984 [Usnochroma carphineum]|nr:MAG: hypothetical protein LQ338_002984 [Usnochroma carphineum]
MDTIKNLGQQASESFQGSASTASKNTNENVAKDSNAGVGTRVSAAKDAVGDKMDEQKHEVGPLSLDAHTRSSNDLLGQV